MPQNETRVIAIVATVMSLLIAGGIWWYARSPSSTNTSPAAVAATEAPVDATKDATPVNLPPLSEMDAFLRPLLQALSSRPELAAWLATDDLVRQLAMAIDQASAGGSPARDFKVLAPTSRFSVTGRGARRTIDPTSYQRYDGLVQTVTSIDAARVAEIYKTIRPRLNEAYQSTGNPGGNVEPALIKTLDILIATPVPTEPVQVVPQGGAAWAFAGQELEELMPTQKQLLRMGPANQEKLQAWLKALRDAL